MKNFRRSLGIVFIVVLALFSFPACIKDHCKRTYTYQTYEPIYRTKDEVRANIRSNPARDISNPGKLFILGRYIFLNEVDKGIHVIDNTDPSHPLNFAFIDIPGNLDIAVKGNTLYADLYSDLVTLDITNPSQVQLKKIISNVFPYRAWGGNFSPDSGKIIIDWKQKQVTETYSCDGGYRKYLSDAQLFFSSAGPSSPSASVSPIGKGGSMARFALINDHLYTVSTTQLDVFNISNSNDPVEVNHLNIGWSIETIYPFKNKLFIGSQSGMFIYNVSVPYSPAPDGQFSHVRVCDPVIADNDYAYVTLRSGNSCQGYTNQLDILDLRIFANPTLVKTYPMTNPHGLSKDGSTLFICDGADGLKVYDATNPSNLQLLKRFEDVVTYDVIAFNHIALVVAKNGLYQYDYTDTRNIRLLSKIVVNN
ncbi:MAG TPA: hypothetical protein VLJ68_12845 [Chitinophagaceae bacterium]|nr:hypothetical protein [Chitinophagaceae bacterium]